MINLATGRLHLLIDNLICALAAYLSVGREYWQALRDGDHCRCQRRTYHCAQSRGQPFDVSCTDPGNRRFTESRYVAFINFILKLLPVAETLTRGIYFPDRPRQSLGAKTCEYPGAVFCSGYPWAAD